MADLKLLYRNMLALVKHRGYTNLQNVKSEDDFLNEINTIEYYKITGERPITDIRGDSQLICILFAVGTAQSVTPSNFEKRLTEAKNKKGNVNLLCFASNEPSSNILANMREVMSSHPNIYVEFINHSKLYHNMTNHVMVQPHSIASAEETAQFLEFARKNKTDFQKILTNDTQAIWLGARAGMVVRIDRASESVGCSTAYRICINAPTGK